MSRHNASYYDPYFDRYPRQRWRRRAELEKLVAAGRGLDEGAVIALLERGEIEDSHLAPWGSNYTYYVVVKEGKAQGLAVYKPGRGEAPLWDFPAGTLCLREYASYLVSRALGWDFIPPTVLRDGPHGLGSLQWYIEADPEENYFTFRQERIPELKRIALFDHLANNADRKGGHCLLGRDGKVWSIDHGLTFHVAPKLRTVIWDFQGEPIPEELLDDLASLRKRLVSGGRLWEQLSRLLARDEIEALWRRLEALLERPIFPLPGPGRNVPWPPL